MASKIKEKLPSRDGLATALAVLNGNGLRDGEFTAVEAHRQHVDGGGTRSLESVRSTLIRMVQKKKLVRRSVVIAGTVTNAYSAP